MSNSFPTASVDPNDPGQGDLDTRAWGALQKAQQMAQQPGSLLQAGS
jgi:hypothetical protein